MGAAGYKCFMQADARWLLATSAVQDFSPCELFQRIRGRTLWLMGDSQMWWVAA